MDLSKREWTVLEALWDSGGGTLGKLTELLRQTTGWNRNTVLTYLTRMEAKGYVIIDKGLYPHIYRAAQNRAECQAQARHSFLDRVYQGAAGELVAAFLREEPLSPEDRENLRRLLDDMEV